MKKISYWIVTIILGLLILTGGIAQAIHQPQTANGVLKLGYPSYFITLIGLWKILGAIVIMIPHFPRLKEWAYAGIFFDVTGASLSFAFTGGAYWHIVVTSMFALLTITSWALRPQSRTLGNIFAMKTL